MNPRPITSGLAALVVPESIQEGQESDRRGFDVEAEATVDSIGSIAALYRGAGYFLECITAVDQEDFRELWYQFNRLENRPDRHLIRLRLEADKTPTISHVFGAANWFEREAFDMMGIEIEGHPYLVRLLLPEDSDFHPLRRDQCIDDELREKREKARAKRLKALEKEKAAAAAAAATEAKASTSEPLASEAPDQASPRGPASEPPESGDPA